MEQLGTEDPAFFVQDLPVGPDGALPNDKKGYLDEMKKAGTWGGGPEIAAIGKSYQIGIEFRHGQKDLGGRSFDHTKFEAYAPGGYGGAGIPQEGAAGKIRLYYHHNIHFQSLFNCAEDAGLAGSGCSDDAAANDPDPPSAPRPSRPGGMHPWSHGTGLM